ITALLKGIPLQYVTGEAYFMGRPFKVSPSVLITRPETEELVQWIIQDDASGNALDIGTGSGCIPISLKLARPDWEVAAIDVSAEALSVAEENAQTLGASVLFLQVDFLSREKQVALGSFDTIVSNPPYIPSTERETLHVNVRE